MWAGGCHKGRIPSHARSVRCQIGAALRCGCQQRLGRRLEGAGENGSERLLSVVTAVQVGHQGKGESSQVTGSAHKSTPPSAFCIMPPRVTLRRVVVSLRDSHPFFPPFPPLWQPPPTACPTASGNPLRGPLPSTASVGRGTACGGHVVPLRLARALPVWAAPGVGCKACRWVSRLEGTGLGRTPGSRGGRTAMAPDTTGGGGSVWRKI